LLRPKLRKIRSRRRKLIKRQRKLNQLLSQLKRWFRMSLEKALLCLLKVLMDREMMKPKRRRVKERRLRKMLTKEEKKRMDKRLKWKSPRNTLKHRLRK
jgi:hypothetical protein